MVVTTIATAVIVSTPTHDLIVVHDPDDERLRPFRLRERGLASRAERREPTGVGLFAAEGDLVVLRALDAGCRPVAAVCRADRPPAVVSRLVEQIPVYGAGDDVRRAVTGLGVPFDVVALFERPGWLEVADVASRASRLLVVEAVDNPSNLGALVRTAVGLGWDALLVDSTSADPLARRSVRTSMGTIFDLRWSLCDDLVGIVAHLTTEDVLTVALTPTPDAVDLRLLAAGPGQRVAMVVGSERSGLSAALQAACSVRARIPMVGGVDSLNVAAAAAIACHHLGP